MQIEMQENDSARGFGVDFLLASDRDQLALCEYSSKKKSSFGLQQTWCTEVMVSLVFKRQMSNTVNSME